MRTLVAMLVVLGVFLIASAALFHTMRVVNYLYNGFYGAETDLAKDFFVMLS